MKSDKRAYDARKCRCRLASGTSTLHFSHSAWAAHEEPLRPSHASPPVSYIVKLVACIVFLK
jgi:hypothetical protein